MQSEKIKQKIAALLKLTAASGCTEAEAMAAAEKAAALMRDHGLSEADIDIEQTSVPVATKGQGARDELWRHVACCTNTAAVFLSQPPGARGSELIFIGRAPGPEIAAYLVAVLNRAVDAGIQGFKASPFYRRRRSAATRRAAVRDFTAGMVSRLSRRLIEIFGPAIDKDANAIARSARDELFAGARALSAPSVQVRFDEAALTGWQAGNSVNLAHGVNGGKARQHQIGQGVIK